MLGNEAARDLLLAAREVRARVVFVGDRDQLPSIEAGRAFAMLADHGLSIATIDTAAYGPHVGPSDVAVAVVVGGPDLRSLATAVTRGIARATVNVEAVETAVLPLDVLRATLAGPRAGTVPPQASTRGAVVASPPPSAGGPR